MPIGPFAEIPATSPPQKIRLEHINEMRRALTGLADAYDVAVAEGFTGTRGEWLASLTGPQGPPGTVPIDEVADVASLPSSGNDVDDVYTVAADGHAYRWNGSAWVDIGQWRGDPGDPLAPGTLGAGEILSSSTGVTVSAFKPGRIDARVRGLSTADSGSANATLLASLASEAATTGAELWLPEGEYRGAFTPVSNLRLNGRGTLKAPTGLAATRDTLLSLTGAVDNLHLSGITLDGNDEVACLLLAGYDANRITNVTITDVTFTNTAQVASGNYNRGVRGVLWDNVLIERCRFRRVGDGISVINPTRTRLIGNDIEDALHNGISMVQSGAATGTGRGNKIIGNEVRRVWRMGVEVIRSGAGEYMAGLIVALNHVEVDESTTETDAMGFSIPGPVSATITGNVARGPNSVNYGYEVGADNAYGARTVSGNICYGFGTAFFIANTDVATYADNESYGAYIGFNANEDCRGLTFTGNLTQGFRDTGYWLQGVSASRQNGGHTLVGNRVIRDTAWTGDDSRQWFGVKLEQQQIPTIIDKTYIEWRETAPTAGLIGKGIGVESGDVAGVVTKTQGTNTRFVVLNSNTWESWSGWPTPKGEMIRTGNTHTSAAGTITDANT